MKPYSISKRMKIPFWASDFNDNDGMKLTHFYTFSG